MQFASLVYATAVLSRLDTQADCVKAAAGIELILEFETNLHYVMGYLGPPKSLLLGEYCTPVRQGRSKC